MKVIFLNRFFHPDISATSHLLTDLATHLASQQDVHVITSRLRYERAGDPLPARERRGRLTVHRVWTSRFGRRSIAGVAVDYLTFYLSASVALARLARPGDVVVAMTDPPMVSIPAAIVARLRRARFVTWLQDVFPEVAWALDFRKLPRWIERALISARNWSLRPAAMNVAVGEIMRDRLVRNGVASGRTRVIGNWASGEEIVPIPPAANPLRAEWDLQDRFVVGYSGNMGRAHDFDALLEAAARLTPVRDVVFLLIGAGNRRQSVEEEVRGRGLTNVIFRPYQPREMVGLSLTVPDCHVVSLRPSLEGLIVPSKVYSSLAAGRPVLFIGANDGEIGRMMTAHRAFGIQVEAGDVDGLVRAIERLRADPELVRTLGRNGRDLFEHEFDRPLALGRWTRLIAELES